MKIGIIDPGSLIYTVQTPRESALGGSESAGSFLALEWARLGHEIWHFSRNPASSTHLGVESRCRDILTANWLEQAGFDVLIELSLPRFLPGLKAQLKRVPLCVLWAHVDAAEKRLQQVPEEPLQAVYDRIVFVSQHQERSYMLRFHLDPRRTQVIPNGINPIFENLFTHRLQMATAKASSAEEVRLIYAASPHKGVDLLPVIFPSFRRRYPAAHLAVYSSSRDLYQNSVSDQLQALPLQRLSEMEGVMCQGALPPAPYAAALQTAQILLYPCYQLRDTCSIVLLEAMAAGCLVLPTGQGALPETAAVFGFFAHCPQPQDLPNALFAQLLRAAQVVKGNPEAYLERIWSQSRYILSRHSWTQSAQSWLTLLRQAQEHENRFN